MGSTIVNGDSSVNIFDLVVVADNFGKSNIAPPPTTITRIELTAQQNITLPLLVTWLMLEIDKTRVPALCLTKVFLQNRDYLSKSVSVVLTCVSSFCSKANRICLPTSLALSSRLVTFLGHRLVCP
jgi:hypothetical protein